MTNQTLPAILRSLRCHLQERKSVREFDHMGSQLRGPVSLGIDPRIYRFLFASPARFVGECDGESFHLTVAFPNWSPVTGESDWLQSSKFALSVIAEEPDRKSILIPTADHAGEEISALLGGYFGKLILNLGPFQSGSTYRVPSPWNPSEFNNRMPPFSTDRRLPGGPTINLAEAKSVIERYIQSQGEVHIGRILRAAELYRAALENLKRRPELGLALLCSTLEALLPLREYSEEELYDEELRTLLAQIAACADGENVVKQIRKRLFQIKRKVAAFVGHYINDTFFNEREIRTEMARSVISDKTDLIERLRNIYDLPAWFCTPEIGKDFGTLQTVDSTKKLASVNLS